MSMKTPTPRWRVVLSLLALAFLLSAHAVAHDGPLPQLIAAGAAAVLLALLARAAIAGSIGWPIGRH